MKKNAFLLSSTLLWLPFAAGCGGEVTASDGAAEDAMFLSAIDVSADGAMTVGAEGLAVGTDEMAAPLLTCLLERFDEDGDGVLSAEEWTTARATLQAQLEERVRARLASHSDLGTGDGEGFEARVQARLALMTQLRIAFMARWDANGDGALDEAEQAAAGDQLRLRLHDGSCCLAGDCDGTPDQDRTREQDQDGDCETDCDGIPDQDRDRTQDQDGDCETDCDGIPDQDRDRTQDQDGDCDPDGDGVPDQDRDRIGQN